MIPVTPSKLSQIWNRTNQKTEGAGLLLGFERRTRLGALPAQTGTCAESLENIADAVAERLNGAWHDLPSHYTRHGQGDELPFLNAAACALRRWAQDLPEMDGETLNTYFPGEVKDETTYGLLAVGLIVMTQFDEEAVQLSLYCPDAPQKHSLSLNLVLPAGWIEKFGGGLAGNGVVVGVTLAGADAITLGQKTYVVPRLHQYFAISTCFSPTTASLPKLKMSGYATTVTLLYRR